MILHRQGEGIVAQFYLFDDIICGAPRFYFKTGTKLVDRLMMRAIYFLKTMACFAIGAKRLNVVRLLIRQVMTADVEVKRAAKRDVESL